MVVCIIVKIEDIITISVKEPLSIPDKIKTIFISEKGVERSSALTNLSANDVLAAIKQLVK